MRNALLLIVGYLGVLLGIGFACWASFWPTRLFAAAGSVGLSFLLGIGFSDRLAAVALQGMLRRNRLLGEQNRDLCEMNARLLQRETFTHQSAGEEPPPSV